MWASSTARTVIVLRPLMSSASPVAVSARLNS
uniref:Uncharacterized protein n=1 Tax=Arundo donax TaxID=35708 RepID=A0A0A9G351_ARUDO